MSIYVKDAAGNRVKVAGNGLPGPAGKSAYQYAVEGGFSGTEAQFAALVGARSNPNLADNGGFDIWQRGTAFDAVGLMYTADRWHNGWQECRYERVDNPFPDCACRYAIKITNLKDNQWCMARELLDPDLVKIMDGETVTVSAWVMGQSAAALSISAGNVTSGYIFPLSDQPQRVSASGVFHADNDESKNLIDIAINGNAGTQTGDWLITTGIKLEFGDIATPYQPPDKALELAKCQRYMLVVPGEPAGYTLIGRGKTTGNSQLDLQIPLPTSMRAKPSVKMTGKWIAIGAGRAQEFTAEGRDIVVSSIGTSEAGIVIFGFTDLNPNNAYTIQRNNDAAAQIILDANL